jgi:hypothetical protein
MPHLLWLSGECSTAENGKSNYHCSKKNGSDNYHCSKGAWMLGYRGLKMEHKMVKWQW